MNLRWYITGLIVALAFFGMSLQQSVVPNQEIIVQFKAYSINTADADAAISEIIGQLKSIGIADIQVSKMHDGKLKVSYYSALDVAAIKSIFSQQKNLHLGHTAFNEREGSSKIPFGSDSGTYKLEVVKIQRDYGADPGFQGLPVAIKSLKDQYLKQVVSFGGAEICFGLSTCTESEVGENYHITTFPIATNSHKIPEVRAGPFS